MGAPFTLEAVYALPRRPAVLLGLALLTLTGALDYVTGYELSLAAMYLLPIMLVTWNGGARWGSAFVVLAIAIQETLGVMQGHVFTSVVYFDIAMLNRLVTYVVVIILSARLRRIHDRERSYARMDDLTGVANRRGLHEVLEREIARHARNGKSLSVAYIDCDNFKSVNDQFGHAAGDQLLQALAAALCDSVRRTDCVARLGGDEFAVIFPETQAEPLSAVVQKLRVALQAMARARGWPVTFSIGVSTFNEMPASVGALMEHADATMYHAKAAGKNLTAWAAFEHGLLSRSPAPTG